MQNSYVVSIPNEVVVPKNSFSAPAQIKTTRNISFLLHLYMQRHACYVTIHVLSGLFAMMFSINVCFPIMHACSFCIMSCDTIVLVYIHASDMQGF